MAAYLLLRVYTMRGSLMAKCFLAVAVWLFSSYIFTPQMVIWIIPLMATQPRALYFWPAIEITNVGIIITWFGDYDPVMPGTPPQVLALLRAISLGLMSLSVYYGERKLSVRELLLRPLGRGSRLA